MNQNCRFSYPVRWGVDLKADRNQFIPLRKMNPNHEPAGSPEGGQFASSGGSGARVFDKGDKEKWFDEHGKRRLPPGKNQIVNSPLLDRPEGVPLPLAALKPGSSAGTESAPIKSVRVDHLVSAQDTIETNRLQAWSSSAPPITVVKWRSHLWVMQGNHRAASAWAANVPEIQAHVLDLDDPKNSKWLKPAFRPKEAVVSLKSNPNHEPAGSSIGGQFASAAGGAKLPRGFVGAPTPEEEALQKKINDAHNEAYKRWVEGRQKVMDVMRERLGAKASTLPPDVVKTFLEMQAQEAMLSTGEFSLEKHSFFKSYQDITVRIGAMQSELHGLIDARIGPPEFDGMRQLADHARPQTETKEFKVWFGASKVVDDAGRPLIAFHGTKADIESFNTTISTGRVVESSTWTGGLGTWFAAPSSAADYDVGSAEFTAEVFAGERAHSAIYPVFLAIKNPAHYEHYEDLIDDIHNAKGGVAGMRSGLIKSGHDGIVIRGSDTDGNQTRDDWVAFHPTQIKSATGNIGTFDPKDPHIGKGLKVVSLKMNPNHEPAGSSIGGQFAPASGASISYEVAPDPNNTALTARWNKLTEEEKVKISEEVATAITPEVLKETGLSGKSQIQFGGYKGVTNPSFAVNITEGADAGKLLGATSMLGHALSQDSMMAVSVKAFKGAEAVGVITVHLPHNAVLSDVTSTYEHLYTLKEGGAHLVGGHSTSNGQMNIMNMSGLSDKEFATRIDSALGGKYQVDVRQAYVAFPTKADYGKNLSSGHPVSSGQSSGHGSADRLRSRASTLIEQALVAHGKEAFWLYFFSEDPSGQALKFNPNHKPGGSSEGGQFTSASGETGMSYDKEKKRWLDADGKPVSEEIAARLKAAGVKPAYTDVRLNLDPNASLQAIGKDAKGRSQYMYSKEHSEAAAAEKFARLKEFNDVVPGARIKIATGLIDKSLSDSERDTFAVLTVIDGTGIRVGGSKDTSADTKAYGASTLLGQHITLGAKGRIDLAFPGKSGVPNRASFVNPTLHSYLSAKNLGPNDRAFATNEKLVNAKMDKVAGPQFSPKDFRTWTGTAVALAEIKGRPIPANAREYAKQRLEVARVVAQRLNNTPTVALAAYIDPAVFKVWVKP